LARLGRLVSTILTLVLSLIDTARKDPEFAFMLRTQILKAVPDKYKDEADRWIRKILDIRAKVISYDHPRPYRRYQRKQPEEERD